MSESYSFVDDTGLLISSERKDYFDFIYDLREGLASQTTGGEERLSLDHVRENDDDMQIDIELYNEEELDDVFRYVIEDENRAVYLFDHHSGSLLLGDGAMAATASEQIEPFLLSDPGLENNWSPEYP